jgi:hypothetical protein
MVSNSLLKSTDILLRFLISLLLSTLEMLVNLIFDLQLKLIKNNNY